MDKSTRLKEFLSEHFDHFKYDGSSNSSPALDHFELFAFDHLMLAEKKLSNFERNKENLDELTDCASELKKAIARQLDDFLCCCNLTKKAFMLNWGFDEKLNFIKDIGVFDSRFLNRLSTYNQKIEQHYEEPEVSDIEVYYDLVTAFISILQNGMFFDSRISFRVYIATSSESIFTSTYDRESNEVEMEWWSVDDVQQNLKVSFDEGSEFLYFLKAHIGLCQREDNNLEYLKGKLIIE